VNDTTAPGAPWCKRPSFQPPSMLAVRMQSRFGFPHGPLCPSHRYTREVVFLVAAIYMDQSRLPSASRRASPCQRAWVQWTAPITKSFSSRAAPLQRAGSDARSPRQRRVSTVFRVPLVRRDRVPTTAASRSAAVEPDDASRGATVCGDYFAG